MLIEQKIAAAIDQFPNGVTAFKLNLITGVKYFLLKDTLNEMAGRGELETTDGVHYRRPS